MQWNTGVPHPWLKTENNINKRKWAKYGEVEKLHSSIVPPVQCWNERYQMADCGILKWQLKRLSAFPLPSFYFYFNLMTGCSKACPWQNYSCADVQLMILERQHSAAISSELCESEPVKNILNHPCSNLHWMSCMVNYLLRMHMSTYNFIIC